MTYPAYPAELEWYCIVCGEASSLTDACETCGIIAVSSRIRKFPEPRRQED